MGHAAYARGSELIRTQIDQEQADRRDPLLDECGRLDNRIIALEARAEGAELEAERLRVELATVRARSTRRAGLIATLVRKAKFNRQRARDAEKWALRAERRWRKASALLRMFTPEQIQGARNELETYYPQLKSR